MSQIVKGLSVMALLGWFTACTPPEPPAADAAQVATAVEVVVLETVNFNTNTTLTGVTEADEIVTVAAELPGRVLSMPLKAGQRVQKGDLIAKVDARVDRSRIGQLRVGLEQAKRDLERTQKLREKGLATPADLERAELAVQNGSYSIRSARLGVGKSTIYAPLTGTVDKVLLKEGEYANPGSPIVRIVKFDELVVKAGLPEGYLRAAQEGTAVDVSVIALGRTVRGVIKRVGIEANQKSRTFPLEVVLDNKDLAMRPGMRADVELQTTTVQDGILVPRTAVVRAAKTEEIVLVENGAAVRRPIETGTGLGEHVLVTKGLKKGDTIMVIGQRIVSHGEKVNVVATGKCCSDAVDGIARRVEPAKPAGDQPDPEAKATP